MPRVAIVVLAFLSLSGCSTRDCCCPRPPACPPAPCAPAAPPPAAVAELPPKDVMMKAAQEGLDQWLYDEVYAANRELQECLLKASKEKDPAAAKKSHDECVARFKVRMKAAEENVVRAREMSTEVINSFRGTQPQPPSK